MCHIQTLAETSDSYVIYCQQCRMLQLMYEYNFVLNVNAEDFHCLSQHLLIASEECSLLHRDDDEPMDVVLDARRTVSLTVKQLAGLSEMVSGASALFEVYQLMDAEN